MRLLLLPTLASVALVLLAGCASPGSVGTETDQLMTVAIASHSERTAACWGEHNQVEVAVVLLQVANAGTHRVTAAEYDFWGHDARGQDIPMCPTDEPSFAPGADGTIELRFPRQGDCDVPAVVVAKQFFAGTWVEVARLPTGIPARCP